MDSNLTLEWAIHYADHGYRVIPIKPAEKRPPIAAWQDHATCNTGTITQWFTQTYPDHGIGIVTGENNYGQRFIVLDIDTKDDNAGAKTIQHLQTLHPPLPDTIEAITGSGGRHLIYLLADHHPMPNNGSGRHLGSGIDIRGHNAQIVVAPTRHPNGQLYTWAEGHAIGEIDPAEAPDWLIEILTPPEYQPAPPNPTVTRGNTTETTEDTRAGTLFNRATDWDTLLLADHWQPHHIDGQGTYHWTRPAKSTKDGESATVNHNGNDLLCVFTTAIHNLPAGTYDRFGYWVATRYNGDFTSAARDLNRQNNPDSSSTDIARWMQTISQQNETPALQIDGQDNHTPALTSWFIDWSTFWNLDSTDTEWLVEPLLAKTRGHALYAGAKSGKSLMLLEIAAALATGQPVLNQQAQPPMHVLYVDYEMSAQDIKDRLESFGYGAGDDLTKLHYALLPSIGGLDTAEGAKYIIDAVTHNDIQLVIIDTTARAVEGAENDADTLRAFYRWTGLALKSKGCTYIRADHAGKDTAKGQRGTSAKNDDVDLVWRFTKRTENNIMLEATHRRMSWVPEKVEIEMVETEHGLRHQVVHDKPSVAAQTMTMTLTRLGVTSSMSLKDVRVLLKTNNIKCAQDTLRAAMHTLRNNTLTALAVHNEQDDKTTSRYNDDETRFADRLDASHRDTTERLASVSPRLDIARHETNGTLSKESLVVDPPSDNPDDLGLF
jgi:RecA-family ATPase